MGRTPAGLGLGPKTGCVKCAPGMSQALGPEDSTKARKAHRCADGVARIVLLLHTREGSETARPCKVKGSHFIGSCKSECLGLATGLAVASLDVLGKPRFVRALSKQQADSSLAMARGKAGGGWTKRSCCICLLSAIQAARQEKWRETAKSRGRRYKEEHVCRQVPRRLRVFVAKPCL